MEDHEVYVTDVVHVSKFEEYMLRGDYISDDGH